MQKPRLAAKDATPEERRAAAALMGSARTQKKVAAALANLEARTPEKRGGKPPKPLFEIPCSCGAGEAMEGHKSSCIRGQIIKRRLAQGRDLITGYLPGEARRGRISAAPDPAEEP